MVDLKPEVKALIKTNKTKGDLRGRKDSRCLEGYEFDSYKI